MIEFTMSAMKNYFKSAKRRGKKKVEAAKQEAEGIIQELRQLRKAQLINVKDHELIEAKSRLEGAAPEQL